MIIRRKLILILGPLVGLMLIAALTSILLLHQLLGDLEHISNDALIGTAAVNNLGTIMTEIEADLAGIRTGDDTHLDKLIDSVDRLQQLTKQVGKFYITQKEGAASYDHFRQLLPHFIQEVGDLATWDPDIAGDRAKEALATSVLMRRDIITLSNISMQHTQSEQLQTTTRFRWMVLGLGVVFLVVLNASILVLLRAASVVLGPVERLVNASRHLAKEEFDYRVDIDQKDEFDELALAFNEMAEELQCLDERRIETLHQVARTLSHHLNNAIEIIDLQLQLLTRSSIGNQQKMSQPLKEIHATLIRMSKTIDSLAQVKQIVLTDYLEGVKMLDLEQSVKPAAHPKHNPDIHTRKVQNSIPVDRVVNE